MQPPAIDTVSRDAAAAAPPAWHALDTATVEVQLGSGPAGLTDDEADRRRRRYGPNQLEEAPPTSALSLLLHQFASPLIYILIAATVITLVLEEYVDAAVIAAVLALNAIIGFTQERRAERAVRALMQLLSPHARVVRQGREREIDSRELVPGDLVRLESGARVPADIRLVTTTGLLVDESLLTGESVPVAKSASAAVAPESPVADRPTMVYAGTVVTSGRASGYVVATGSRTELGAIAAQMRAEVEPATPLQQRMTRFARVIGGAVAAAAAAAFGIGVAMGQSMADMFMVAVALAVSAVPEGLPVVFTITLAIGVNRMARRQAVIRRLPAVETLGSTTVIGSDKTGTLTENRMAVREVWAGDEFHGVDGAPPGAPGDAGLELPAAPLDLALVCGVLTNEAELYDGAGGQAQAHGDPTETALLVSARARGWDPAALRRTWRVVADLPFEPERQYSATIRDAGRGPWLFVKGAPERVLAMCSARLGPDGPQPIDERAVHAAARRMGSRGLRVLAMACRPLGADVDLERTLLAPAGLTLAGLQGLIDPPRPGVGEAIAACRHAGIRVVMITGDHAHTAEAIGRQIGLEGAVMTGPELAALTDEGLAARLEHTAIYARVAPDQKLRIVRAFRARGEVVAVTGDGVNDAPALKAADIGIAMGRSGTDVAREAADMVLADDNFVSIVAAVEEGRITFDNVRKVTFFLVSSGAAEVLMILTALAAGWPLPLLAAQILWLNLVTNGLQDVALAFEPGEPDVLAHPPRDRREGVMSRLLWERTAVAGAVMAAGTLAMFLWELDRGGSLTRAQTVALTTMVLFQVFHVGNCRSEHASAFARGPLRNPFLFAATAAALLVHVAALYLPWTQFVLRVEPLDWPTWIRLALVAITIVAAVEIHKLVRRPRWAAGRARPTDPPSSVPGPGAAA